LKISDIPSVKNITKVPKELIKKSEAKSF